MVRFIQNLLFDAGDLSPAPSHRPRLPLTAEERARRKKLRERLRRRQRALFEWKARKTARRRKARARRNGAAHDPNRAIHRPKSLASPLYNLPAALVDDICLLNLRNKKHFQLAVFLAERFVLEEEQHNRHDPDLNYSLKEIKRTLQQIARESPDVAENVQDISEEWRERAEAVQSTWTANHERKANNYYVPPLEYRPNDDGLDEVYLRDVIE